MTNRSDESIGRSVNRARAVWVGRRRAVVSPTFVTLLSGMTQKSRGFESVRSTSARGWTRCRRGFTRLASDERHRPCPPDRRWMSSVNVFHRWNKIILRFLRMGYQCRYFVTAISPLVAYPTSSMPPSVARARGRVARPAARQSDTATPRARVHLDPLDRHGRHRRRARAPGVPRARLVSPMRRASSSRRSRLRGARTRRDARHPRRADPPPARRGALVRARRRVRARVRVRARARASRRG